MIPTLTRRWLAISAAAAPMSAFAAPSIAPRRRSDAMENNQTLSRGQFVVTGTTLAGGLALGLVLPGKAHAATPELAARYWADDAVASGEVNAWVVINPDNSVVLHSPMAEMGQGTGSGIGMLLAEELGCDWKNVTVEFASVNRTIREHNVYRDMVAAGSP